MFNPIKTAALANPMRPLPICGGMALMRGPAPFPGLPPEPDPDPGPARDPEPSPEPEPGTGPDVFPDPGPEGPGGPPSM